MRRLIQFFILQLVFLILLEGSTSSVYAGEPIPFGDKFERQRTPGYQGGHVWKMGERIRAPFQVDCAETLRLVVADGVPGGVEDSRHADEFDIIAASSEIHRQLRSYRGRTFEGIVEIANPVDQEFFLSNMQRYSARIVSISPPKAPVNPSREELHGLAPGSEVILRGKVIALDERGLIIETDKSRYRLNLWSGIPVIDGDIGGRIRNLTGKERIVMGDEVQIRAYLQEDGSIGTHWCRSCFLARPSSERYQAYLAERKQVSLQLVELKSAIFSKDWKKVREISARFMKNQLTPTELERHETMISQIPPTEQPLRIVGSHRYEVEDVNQIFNIDIDGMTRQEFYDFAKRWAANEVGSVLPRKESSDEAYIFRVFDNIQAPEQWYREIAEQSILTRLSYFEARSQAGEKYDHDRDWRQYYNVERSLQYGSNHSAPTARAARFYVDIARRVVSNDVRGWGFKGQFTFDVVEAVQDFSWNTAQGVTLDHQSAQATLKELLPVIQGIHNDLLAMGIAEARAEGSLTIVGMPDSISIPGGDYGPLRNSVQLGILDRIIDQINSWP